MLIFFAGGVLYPPFSIAGKKLGKDDERDQFPEALRLISESTPKNCNVRKCKTWPCKHEHPVTQQPELWT